MRHRSGQSYESEFTMMTSSNGNIFCVTGPLCGEFTGPGEFSTQRPVTRSFDVFFDLRMNKPWGWWFETPSWSLWRQCNDCFKSVLDHEKKWPWLLTIFRHQYYWNCRLDLVAFVELITDTIRSKFEMAFSKVTGFTQDFWQELASIYVGIIRIINMLWSVMLNCPRHVLGGMYSENKSIASCVIWRILPQLVAEQSMSVVSASVQNTDPAGEVYSFTVSCLIHTGLSSGYGIGLPNVVWFDYLNFDQGWSKITLRYGSLHCSYP